MHVFHFDIESTNHSPFDTMGACGDVWHVLKIYWSLLLGNILEWYEFAIFAFLEPYLQSNFFHGSAITTWLGFASTFLARPFGGLVLGILGDLFGRKVSTFLSILGMLIGTVGQGMVPTYQSGQIPGTIGVVLLVVFRILQGICTGGEIAAVSTYITEVGAKRSLARCMVLIGITCTMGLVILKVLLFPKILAAHIGHSTGLATSRCDRKLAVFVVASLGFFFFVCQVHVTTSPSSWGNIGFLLAQFASYLALKILGEPAMTSWGWRIPFIIALLPGTLAVCGRRCIPETPSFVHAQAEAAQAAEVWWELGWNPTKNNKSLGWLRQSVTMYTTEQYPQTKFQNISEVWKSLEVLSFQVDRNRQSVKATELWWELEGTLGLTNWTTSLLFRKRPQWNLTQWHRLIFCEARATSAFQNAQSKMKSLFKSHRPAMLVSFMSVAAAAVIYYGALSWCYVLLQKGGASSSSLIMVTCTSKDWVSLSCCGCLYTYA